MVKDFVDQRMSSEDKTKGLLDAMAGFSHSQPCPCPICSKQQEKKPMRIRADTNDKPRIPVVGDIFKVVRV